MSSPTVVRASAHSVRQTPRKLGLVAALVRGRSVAEALIILGATPKRAAKPLTKLVTSVKANAVNNHSLTEASLQIARVQVSAGPRIKRVRAGAMGRAKPYQKRFSNLLIEVTGEVKPKKPATKTTAKETT